jgi:outer membrane protein assembly factor BamB
MRCRLAAAAGLGIASCWPLLAFAQAPQPAPVQLAQQRPAIRGVPRTPGPDARGDDELSLDGVFLPPDRTAKRRLDTAQQMLEDRRFGEGVRLLGSLLENAEDFFFKPNPEQPVYRSLKAEAGRLIAAMPNEGRDSYELQFGARARQMLKQAALAGNLADMAEVSRRFFFTQAGQEATFLFARHHLDQNRPLAAALCLERLRETSSARARMEPVLSLTLATCWLRSGKPDKAKETLVRLKRSNGGAEIILGGKPVQLFTSDAQALAWMEEKAGVQHPANQPEAEQWTLFRGDESRNAASSGGQPLLNVRWRQRTADDSTVEKFISKVRRDLLNQEIVALPSLHPLAIGDVVIMRTAFALQAVDFQNGKLVWRYPSTDDSLEQFLKAGTSQQPAQGTQQLFAGVDQRMWEDATYGTLSSDGSQVYYVEDLGLAGVNFNSRMTVLPNGHRNYSVNSRGTNRLAARELRTQGKLKWEIGGITGEDEPKLAGAFFLGPPLPLLGHLYALAEMKGQEIRLLVLSAATGALEWSQQLAVVEQSVVADGFRRNAGATPSFADGVLVCPTSAGAIVAIDLTTRSLLWGYQYPRAPQYPTDRFNVVRPAIYAGTERRANEHWADGSITISDGRALVTPPEADQIYCLSLSDGKELWKQGRGNNLYVGCVHRGDVVLIGRNTVSAVRLADGEKAWTDLELPADSMPSGRGFTSGEFYYLPLTTAEVAKINLTTGRIEQRSRSRSGHVPGNLVSYRGSIISQGVDYLDAYFQIDSLKEQIAKTLAAHPDDAKALAGLGEVKLDQGALKEAVDLFRRSYRLKNDEATRQQLVESLLEALRVDFAANRGSLDELEALIEQPTHRLTFLRLKALGLQSAGDVGPAFETYMKLVDEHSQPALDAVDEHVTVQRDRWIRAQLEPLRAAANADAQQQIDVVVAARLKTAIEAQSAGTLRAFLGVFGSHPAAETARDALLSRLGGDDLLERNLLLRRRERSTDQAQVAATTARMAHLLRDAGRAELAAIYYRQLAGRFAQVECQDGKTGEQLVAELPDDDPLRKGLAADRSWPAGKVTAREEKAPPRIGSPPRVTRAIDLDVAGDGGPFFDDVTISYDAQQQSLVAHDGLGERRFRFSLNEQGTRRLTNRNAYNAPLLSHVSADGGLLVLSVGTQLIAIDALSAGDGSAKGILWTQDLNEQLGGFSPNHGVGPRLVNLPWGGARTVAEDAAGRRLGSIGPVNDDGIYFQRLHDLYCVEPLTGKTVWMRKNVGLGNDLFGDDELLFAAPTSDGDTLVLRAATGELLGTRRIAPFNKRMATIGRLVLSWELQGAKHVLQMRNPWLDETLWSFPFEPGAKAALVGQEAVGVLQPNGEFLLIALADGKPLVKERLEPETSLMGIYLLRSRAAYLLVTNCVTRNEPNVSVLAVPNVANSPLINGRVYAFEAGTGKKMWPAPAVLSQQSLLLSQPSELPVLVLARQIHRPGPVKAQDPKISVLCIDKRSGRVVYQNEQLPGSPIANFELSADPAARTVTIAIASKVITLSFTEDAVEPQAAAPPGTRGLNAGRPAGAERVALQGFQSRREPANREPSVADVFPR